MQEYKNVGTHAEDLADGRVVGQGELAWLTSDELRDPHNKRLVSDGILIPTENERDDPPVDATPAAIDYAEERGVDLSEVTGTGKSGRVTKEDVENHLNDEGGDD